MTQEWKTGTENDYVVRTCAWSAPGCHPVGCGLKLHVVDGKLVGVDGDENHAVTKGRLCPRCLTLAEYVYHPDRIIYPMKRDPKDRGKDKWERITWDEALDIIVAKTEELQAKYGRETVMIFGGTGRQATLYGPAMASAVFRTPHHVFAMSGQACYGPRQMVANYVCGNIGYPEIDTAAHFAESYENPDYTVPECILLWGKDPLPSNPDGLFGHAVIDLMKRGTQVVMIDPRVTWLGSRADLVVQIRPGTDAAIGMAMLNVIIEEDLYDHDFVKRWTFGFDALRERVATMPPEKAAQICWCDAEKIRQAARMFANAKPASIACGLPHDQQLTGGQAFHCAMAMVAVCGNLDIPGGNTAGKRSDFLGKWRIDTQVNLEPGAFENRLGSKEFPAFSAYMFSTQPDIILETLEKDEPIKLRMAVFQSSNVLAPSCNVQPQRWYEAFKKLEFVVVTDLFMNPTASAFGDIFLPVSTFPEQNSVVVPYYGTNMPFVGAINKAITVGECKDDIEINIAIGRRLNPDAWPWETAEEFFEDQCQSGFGISFEELQNQIVYYPGYTYKKYEKGLGRPDGRNGFNSPTAKIELKSSLFERFGEDPLPYFMECPYTPVEEAAYGKECMRDYPLVLTTGARRYTSFHSEHRMIETLREIDPWPIVQIHPDDAEKYGVDDGDWATLENMFGKCNMKVEVTPIIKRGVVMAAHGWWFPEESGEEPNLYGNWKANVNALMAHKYNNPLGYGSIHKNMCCSIRKAGSLDDPIELKELYEKACAEDAPSAELLQKARGLA